MKNRSLGVFRIDSATVSSLQSIANSNCGLPGAYARNLLIAAGKITFQEPVILPDTMLKSTKRTKYRGVKQPNSISQLTIYPNPAKDYIVVEYHLESKTDHGLLTINDSNGKKIKSVTISAIKDQIIIPVADLVMGMYVLSLNIDGKRVGSAKIAIIN